MEPQEQEKPRPHPPTRQETQALHRRALALHNATVSAATGTIQAGKNLRMRMRRHAKYAQQYSQKIPFVQRSSVDRRRVMELQLLVDTALDQIAKSAAAVDAAHSAVAKATAEWAEFCRAEPAAENWSGFLGKPCRA
jgi:hypothetical protein